MDLEWTNKNYLAYALHVYCFQYDYLLVLGLDPAGQRP